MANVNIKRDVTDQFYRYKMPLLIAKVEGARAKGGGGGGGGNRVI